MGILFSSDRRKRHRNKLFELKNENLNNGSPHSSESLFIFADWLGFRGTHGNGMIDGQISPEISMDSKNSWTAQLPGRGLSSPILVDDLVVLTASSDPNQSTLHILAFDAKNGDLAWERRFKATGRTICHNKTCVAASTMVSDGKVVVAQFSSNDIFCLDLDGNIKWLRGLTYDYPNIANGLGMSSSPVLAKGVMITAQVENDADSFTFGLNLQNGMSIWRKNRPRGANWTSPVVLKKGSSTWVGLQSKKGLAFINPLDGEVLWNFEGGASTIPSSAITDENTVIVPSNGLTAFEQPIAAKSPTTKWKNNKLAPEPGPTVFDKKFFCREQGQCLTSASTENGEINWRLRIKGPVARPQLPPEIYCWFSMKEGSGKLLI